MGRGLFILGIEVAKDFSVGSVGLQVNTQLTLENSGAEVINGRKMVKLLW